MRGGSEIFFFINGINFNWIEAKGGFCQGYPLSPYLFILCSQLLSDAFKKKGGNLSIKIDPNAPRVLLRIYGSRF